MTKEEKQNLCKGCRDDFYNQTQPNGCWSLETAEPVERTAVGWWQNPPYTWRPQTTLSCHHAPGQTAWIKRDDVRIRESVKQDV